MSKIEQLIREFCPKDVPEFQLMELVTFEKGSHLSDDDFQSGVYPVVTASRSESRRHAFSNVGPKSVTITSHGAYAGHVNFWEDPIWLAGNVFLLKPNPHRLSEKFLFYLLKNSEETIQGRARGGGIPYMNSSDLKGLVFPLPPLEVQKEIVSILDKFTQLEAELEAELEARRTQYEVTRDRLLDFSSDLDAHPLKEIIRELCPEGVQNKPIDNLISSLRTGLNPRSNFVLSPPGATGWYVTVRELNGFEIKYFEQTDRIDAGAIRIIQNRSNLQAGDVLFSGTGTIGKTALVSSEPIDWNIKEGVYAMTPKPELINSRFLIYLIQSSQIRSRILASASGSTVKSISFAVLQKLEIPAPPMAIQELVVSILDKLDALVNDITIGLPAEIAARRKQYEYYRNKLLHFKELDAA